ncbi:NAD(P)-binding protein [Clavulina sp. PMI_390]|nr:NAD(P)-binding protein [Clavulina sp. PMI_390]
MNVCIVGGHGKVALRLAKILSAKKHVVTSVIRDAAHAADIAAVGAHPFVLSLEDSPASAFTALFQSTKSDLVYFSAGAGGKGGEERTKKVDYEGAVKIFDAIEGVKDESKRPGLVLVSGIDVRREEAIPEHYDEEDEKVSERVRKAIPAWMKWKYEADLVLSKRTAFKWFILRPGGLLDEPGTGTADVGITHLTNQIPRDDVAEGLAWFAEDYPARLTKAAGLALDFVGGSVPIADGLEAGVARGKSAFVP